MKISTFLPRRQAGNFQLKNAFGLIEFLVAISILGITAAAITASYLTFERNQRVKNAARTLKSDIRLAQNKALSGDKALGAADDQSAHCKTTHELLGWYVAVERDKTDYSILGYCLNTDDPGGHLHNHIFDAMTVKLPEGVKIYKIECGPANSNALAAYIHFYSLTTGAVFHSSTTLFPTMAGRHEHVNLLSGGCNDSGGELTITLLETIGTSYKVIIKKSGEVNESK